MTHEYGKLKFKKRFKFSFQFSLVRSNVRMRICVRVPLLNLSTKSTESDELIANFEFEMEK